MQRPSLPAVDAGSNVCSSALPFAVMCQRLCREPERDQHRQWTERDGARRVRQAFVDTARGRFCISPIAPASDAVAAHAYLTNSYWSPGIPIDIVRRRASGLAVAFGLYDEAGARVGVCARIVTDHATFAYLWRRLRARVASGTGALKALLLAVTQHPVLQSVRAPCWPRAMRRPLRWFRLSRTRIAGELLGSPPDIMANGLRPSRRRMRVAALVEPSLLG